MDTHLGTAEELAAILDRAAHHIVDAGTKTEVQALRAMARAARDLRPGAASALTDWAAPEIVRLRAFGLVHGAVLRELGAMEQERLRGELLGANAMALAV